MKKMACLLALLMLLTGCKREGFEESLGKRKELEAPSQSEETTESEGSEEIYKSKVLTFQAKEDITPNMYIMYSLPEKNGINDSAAEIITSKITEILDAVKGSFDLSTEDAKLEIYDSVGIVNEDVVSLLYEGQYMSDKLNGPSKFAFGLNFSAKTGGQMTVSDVMQPHTLASLILDSQSSEVRGNAEEAESKRQKLSQKGMSALADRITAADSQRDTDALFTFSYFLEKGRMIAIIPMDDDLTAPLYVSVFTEKV